MRRICQVIRCDNAFASAQKGQGMHKQRTLESYRDRLSRVTDYLHDHLEDELSFDRLAEIACLSPYHWSRIYHAI
jgi:AraC family transcriptional regulator